MRTIKFEYGFESVNGIVKKVYALSQIPNIEKICDVWNILPIVYVRQFTGLQDKNGVDIYEGDNIRVCDNKNGLLTVVFVNEYVGGWVLIHESTKNKLSLGARKSNTIEVIGNIHEK